MEERTANAVGASDLRSASEERFTCERFKCTMRKEVCVKRQTEFAGSGSTFRYKYLECDNCPQGALILGDRRKDPMTQRHNDTHKEAKTMEESKEQQAEPKKICRTCKKPHPLENYSKAIKAADGHKSQCKDCDRAYSKRHWAEKHPPDPGISRPPVSRSKAKHAAPNTVPAAPLISPADELAAAHWSYIQALLQAHEIDMPTDFRVSLSLIEFHYKTAFVHGFGHGNEARSASGR